MTTKKPATTAAKGSNTGGAERVVLRNEFYRDGFRVMAAVLPIVILMLCGSLYWNYVQSQRKPMERYFSVDGAGRITKIVALTEPYVSEAYLANWVSEKVSRSYSLDPQNYVRQVADLEAFYTADGHDQYVQSLVTSGTIDLMTKNMLIMRGVPTGAPLVASQGEINGMYFWKVRIPMSVEYRSSTKSAQKRRIVEVMVVRRMTLESPEGIGIAQFVASDA